MILAEELFPAPDPAAACERLAGLPYRMFLDSAAAGPEAGAVAASPRVHAPLGRYSFLSADPSFVIEATTGGAIIRDRLHDTEERVGAGVLSVARAFLRPFTESVMSELPPFQGGFAGYIGYEFGATLDDVPRHGGPGSGFPDLSLGLYDWVVAWDHVAGRAWLLSTGIPERDARTRCRRARARLSAIQELLHGVAPMDGQSLPHPNTGWRDEGPSQELLEAATFGRGASFSREEYVRSVAAIRELIHDGDLFQANLSQQFRAPATEAAWPLYRRLRSLTPSPFAAYLEMPQGAVLSASPERFLAVSARGQVETRPIKGTRPRGDSTDADAALAAELLASDKDRAENLMIVDLMRNDLSRVCVPGSVRVTELLALERWTTVHHLVSTVVGRLARKRDAFDLIAATFPGGSITGAPKLRAMEVIAEHEPTERGIYCGSIGYIGTDGAMDMSIAIRTLVHTGTEIAFSAGGGIVADSDPETEYEETLTKARGIVAALASGTLAHAAR